MSKAKTAAALTAMAGALGVGAFFTTNVAIGEDAVPPTVVNLAASGVSDNAATANCRVNAGNNEEVAVFVTYKKSTDAWGGVVHKSEEIQVYGNIDTDIAIPLPGVPPETDMDANVDLVPATGYDYRCKVAVNDDGQNAYVDTTTKSFTTSADVQTTTNGVASNVREEVLDANGDPIAEGEGALIPTEMTVSCGINPKGPGDTNIWVVWKKSSDTWSTGPVYGDQSGDDTIVNEAGRHRTLPVAFHLRNLTANTSYDFRCKSDISGAPLQVDSNTVTFTTPAS